MATDFGVDPSVTSLLGRMDVYLLTVTNPDGYVYTHTKVSLIRICKTSAEIVTSQNSGYTDLSLADDVAASQLQGSHRSVLRSDE